jgi:hypothetical protein
MQNFSLKLYKWSLKSATTNIELVPDSLGRITLDSLSTSFLLNYYPTYLCSPSRLGGAVILRENVLYEPI